MGWQNALIWYYCVYFDAYRSINKQGGNKYKLHVVVKLQSNSKSHLECVVPKHRPHSHLSCHFGIFLCGTLSLKDKNWPSRFAKLCWPNKYMQVCVCVCVRMFRIIICITTGGRYLGSQRTYFTVCCSKDWAFSHHQYTCMRHWSDVTIRLWSAEYDRLTLSYHNILVSEKYINQHHYVNVVVQCPFSCSAWIRTDVTRTTQEVKDQGTSSTPNNYTPVSSSIPTFLLTFVHALSTNTTGTRDIPAVNQPSHIHTFDKPNPSTS